MSVINAVVKNITSHIPTSLDGWHRVFSIFTVIMIPISFVYVQNLPDLPHRTNESCYIADAMITWIECDSIILEIFWNSFHPFYSLYILFSYFFPIGILVYISAYRGICIISYKVIIVVGKILKSKKFVEAKNYVAILGKKKLF